MILGFFRSVALGGENPIQDSLRLLTLWFKFGADEEVTAVVAENVNTVSIDTWLEVVPQVCMRNSFTSCAYARPAYCPHSNPEPHNPSTNKRTIDSSWTGTSSSPHLPSHRRLQIQQSAATYGSRRNHGSPPRAQCLVSRASELTQLSFPPLFTIF